MNPAVTQSLLMAKHLRHRNPQDPAWVQDLDRLFLSSAFEKKSEEPFFTGPDDLPYYGFHAARSHDLELISFEEAINSALHWAAGAAVYPGGGGTEWVYSPGDLVSLSLCRTSAFQWQGDWGQNPILEDYSNGTTISIGRPSPEFLAPLAVRCLEVVLRKIYKAEPLLQERVPGIAVLRPESRTRPEQASELLINAYFADFETRERAEGFQTLVRRFLPSHYGRRLISFDSQMIPDERFAPLIELIAEGGLEPAPEAEST